jgi:hypothetical protein
MEAVTLSLALVWGITFGALGIPLAEQIGTGSRVVEVKTAHGSIDWGENGVIRAVGIGVQPIDAVNATHAREMAKRAATVVARRNLLEIVQGIHVDSRTTVKNYMVEKDVINNKVQGIVKNARIIKEQEFPDGSWQVTVEMKLRGELQSAVVPSGSERPQPIPFGITESKENLIFTGLVINAKGLEVQEALSPKILMEDGRVVYGAEWVNPETPKDQGLVGYIRGIQDAKSHERVTATPFVVKALRVTGGNKTDLVISDADAQTLHVVPEHLEFLENARVLVVLD